MSYYNDRSFSGFHSGLRQCGLNIERFGYCEGMELSWADYDRCRRLSRSRACSPSDRKYFHDMASGILCVVSGFKYPVGSDGVSFKSYSLRDPHIHKI